MQRISNDWFQEAKRSSLLTRLFQIRSKEISQANLTGDTVASNFAPVSGWIGRHTRAHAGSRSLQHQHERGPSICSPSALRSTPPQSTAHLSAPSPPPSAPSGIGLGDAQFAIRVLRLVMFPPSNGCQIVVVFQLSSVEILLENRHFTQELPVLQSLLFQGAPFGFDLVGPLHKETDPAAQDLQLPPGWSPVLPVLSSGVPRIARSPSTDGSTGSVANRDSVRCRGPTGAGQLAAVHTIHQTFVLAVVRSQIKVFGADL